MPRSTILKRKITYEDDKGVERETTVLDYIVNAIGLGVPRKFAAQAAGISERTLHQCLAKGRELLDEDGEIVEALEPGLTDDQRLYARLAQGVEKADGQAVAYAIGVVRKHMPDNWQAAMTWLERRHPGHFARRIEIDADPADRDPAPAALPTAAQVEEAFRTANVPEGIEASGILPALPPGPEEEPAGENGKVERE